MSTSVKHIHSGMRGAPVVNGVAGTLIPALDVATQSGCGITTAISVTVSGGIATAQLTPGETFDRDAVILVAGASPGALNGEARVLSTSNTSITFATTAADGVATGTITIKYAPQSSWVSPFAKTNVKVYQSTHVQSHGHLVRVDDTGTTNARVRGYETMTDVDTGTGPFPTDAQIAGGGYWRKRTSASATAVPWRIFSDERTLLVAIAANFGSGATHRQAPLRGFGDPLELAPSGDAWSTFLSVEGVSDGNVLGSLDSGYATQSTVGGTFMARAISGLGGAVPVNPVPYMGAATLSGADAWMGALPSEVDGAIRPSRMFLREQSTGKPPRAVVPGVYYLPHSGALGPLADGDILTGADELAGRRLMVVAMSQALNQAAAGCYLVDITGPWR